MEEESLLQQIESLLQELSIPIRYEKGNFHGGLCKVNGQAIFIVNKKLTIDQKINLFASELRQLDLSNVFIVPAVREILTVEEETAVS